MLSALTTYPAIRHQSLLPFQSVRFSGHVSAEDSVHFAGQMPSPVLGERFQQALSLALELHASQTRKGTRIPYVSHLMSVASIALKFGGDEDEVIAALLHDAVEDQGGTPTLARIQKQFGDRVANIVSACSDTDITPKPPWRDRKEAYIAHIATASSSARLVSAADKLDNCRDTIADYQQQGEALWSRFNAPNRKEDIIWYYRALTEAFRQAGDSPLVQELDRTVTHLERLANGQALDCCG